MLIDRLRISHPNALIEIWNHMLDTSRENAELCNLLFHPERAGKLLKSMDKILKRARDHGDIWLASLDQVASWWLERSSFAFHIEPGSSSQCQVTAHCSPATSVVLQHPGGSAEFLSFTPHRPFTLNAPLKPVVSVRADAFPEEARLLGNEGFFVDEHANPGQCAFVVDRPYFGNPRALLTSLRNAQGPLVRFGRWPERKRSALCVSFDLDALSLTDFVRRIGHFANPRNGDLVGLLHETRPQH